jgi:hypothetical protein
MLGMPGLFIWLLGKEFGKRIIQTVKDADRRVSLIENGMHSEHVSRGLASQKRSIVRKSNCAGTNPNWLICSNLYEGTSVLWFSID